VTIITTPDGPDLSVERLEKIDEPPSLVGTSALLGHRYPTSWTKHERARLAREPAVPLMAAVPGPPSDVAEGAN
jgi:hypothetical protein